MANSCAFYRASNISILDYPLEASVSAALALVDEVVIGYGHSEDNTAERCSSIYRAHRGRVRLKRMEFRWDVMWQEHWWDAVTSISDAEWLVWLDADELIHSDDVRAIKAHMALEETWLINFPFLNFYATPEFVKNQEFRNTRIGRRSCGYHMRNRHDPSSGVKRAACNMEYNGGMAHSATGAHVVQSNIPIYHYGWCRDAHALAISRAKHEAWYAGGGGLEDGRIPEVKDYDFDLCGKLERGWARHYETNHPEQVIPWLNRHIEEHFLLRKEALCTT